MTRVVLLAYPGVDELDLFGAYAVLAKAVDARITAARPQVTGSAGILFAATDGLSVAADADALVVPGGRGARDAAADPELLHVLRAAGSRGTAVFSVCSGALLVAAAGLAAGRRLAVHRNKRTLLAGYPVGEVVTGLVRDGQLRSVGGDRQASVKAVDIAFRVLAEFAPDTVDAVSARTEILPGRVPS
ncbi:DJ-1/PfpI family protein [Kutzneria buriramensis]|uniref:DJ-1/PfpI family protein n=1 Tax=Kutzneria buriramensis TaxID=1045776 RepID=A0A3E0G821_9PSEU|nr:DJ-1/PfpI family protein [Kutzneria buriramensis]REH18146.1 DJ-1/PfpI family protein [Kutzneria buriramensis]